MVALRLSRKQKPGAFGFRTWVMQQCRQGSLLCPNTPGNILVGAILGLCRAGIGVWLGTPVSSGTNGAELPDVSFRR